MNILLTSLNSKYIHTNLALRYLYETAKDFQDKIQIKEFTINHEEDYIFSEIVREQYDIICLSCYIWNITQILYLTSNIRKVNKDVIIILGGQEVSFDSEHIIEENPQIDYIIRGEGEKTFIELMHFLTEGEGKIEAIKGITYQRDNKIISNEERELIQDLDEVSFPYGHYFPYENRIIYYETSRGCPYHCSYCMSSVIRGVRYFSLERVKKDLSFFLKNHVPQVKFVDRTFNANQKRCMAIMQYICENDNGKTNFHFEMNGDQIDEAMLSFLKTVRKGLFQFEIGVQTTNPKTIEAINRKTDFDKIKYNVKKLNQYGNIHLHLDLIAGLPYEDYNRFLKSFNDVYDTQPHNLQLGFLKLLKGAKIREEADQHGYIFRAQEPYEILSNQYLSHHDLIRLKRIEEMLDKFYNRPGFQTTLKYMITNYYEQPSDFYEDLAEYWHANGYQHEAHNKKALYELLKAFCIKKNASEELLDELLLYDKMLISQQGQMPHGSADFTKSIHNILHHQEFRTNFIPSYEHLKVKEIKKKISFQIFQYNVYQYAVNGDNLNRLKNLCIFDYKFKDIKEQAKVYCLNWELAEKYAYAQKQF